MESFVVRRSAWRMWAVSVLAIPVLVLAVDVLTQRRLTNALRDVLFQPDDTQLFEFRDVVWAWALLAAAGGTAIWALRELMFPTRVVAADRAGLRLQVTAPFTPPLFVAWPDVADIGSARVDDEGEALPVLWVRFAGPDIGPDEPWNGRWMDRTTIALLATDWDTHPIEVAKHLTELALGAAEERQAADVGPPPSTSEDDPETVFDESP